MIALVVEIEISHEDIYSDIDCPSDFLMFSDVAEWRRIQSGGEE
jgi:hypothetical protein